jgi:hypothetical protein
MLNFRRRSEMRADQRTPFLKIRRLTEIDGVVFQGFPLDVQPVARRLLDRAVQLKALPTLAALENRFRLGNGGSKSFSLPGLISICAISVIMVIRPFWLQRALAQNHEPEKTKGTKGALSNHPADSRF